MRVDCNHCGKAINIPPKKVPDRTFSFSCPACQGRIKVEPPSKDDAVELVDGPDASDAGPASHDETRPVFDDGAEVPATAAGPPKAAASEAAAPEASAPPPLKTHERQLMAALSPLAYIVELGASTDKGLDADLTALGMEEIRRFTDLEDAIQQLLETEVGILVIAVPKAAAPPFKPLEPLAKIPSRVRRRTFVSLMASNVTSLDGQAAFFLQVNCLLNAQESQRRRGHLQRALLHHLKLYQHWTLDVT